MLELVRGLNRVGYARYRRRYAAVEASRLAAKRSTGGRVKGLGPRS
jgi:hypothetical protein